MEYVRLLYDCKTRKVHFRNVNLKKSSFKFVIADNVIMKDEELIEFVNRMWSYGSQFKI